MQRRINMRASVLIDRVLVQVEKMLSIIKYLFTRELRLTEIRRKL